MSILKEKAEAIVDAIIDDCLASFLDKPRLCETVLKALINDGGCTLLESDNRIEVKVDVRDNAGKIIGKQG